MGEGVRCFERDSVVVGCVPHDQVDLGAYLSQSQDVLVPYVVGDSIARSDWVLVNTHVARSIVDGMRDPEQILGEAVHELPQETLLL